MQRGVCIKPVISTGVAEAQSRLQKSRFNVTSTRLAKAGAASRKASEAISKGTDTIPICFTLRSSLMGAFFQVINEPR